MAKFLSEKELYPAVKEKSAKTKDVLWVCSPYLGYGAHEVFSEEIGRTPPGDVRFIFKLSMRPVKRGVVNPHEIEYIQKHLKGCKIKTNDIFHSKIYIFDDSAVITSANLSKTAFGKNIEAGVLLNGAQFTKAKRFFENLWKRSDPIKNLNDFKRAWRTTKGTGNKGDLRTKTKVKPHTSIQAWDENLENKWLVHITDETDRETERSIYEATNWKESGELVTDLRRATYNSVGTGDIIYLQIDYEENQKPKIEKGKVIDKRMVETDRGGKYHLAYESIVEKKIEKSKLEQWLEESKIGNYRDAVLLNNQQAKSLEQAYKKPSPK